MDATLYTHYGAIRDERDDNDKPYVPAARTLAPSVDLRAGCATVYDQGKIRSCSANALASALTFLEKKAERPIVLPSRLFMYYNARALTNDQACDSGTTIRNAIKALKQTGACDEALWPYDPAQVAHAPPQACYDHASIHAFGYYRLSQTDLSHAKACLAEGYPFVFGIEIYHGPLQAVNANGHLTMPDAGDTPLAGHAVMAVGYDDATQTIVALNSEGPSWGLSGYFTIPYAYMTDVDLTFDLWTIRKMT